MSSLGEEGLIAAIRGWLGKATPPAPFGIGDDCAVLPPQSGRLLLTVDPVIHGRHFDDAVPAGSVGAKLLKRNLSDLAGMGGRPAAAVVALTLDPHVSLEWLKAFHRGLADCARRHRVPIVGGDIAQASGTLAASLTLLGTLAGPRAVTRNGGRRGDWICVTGRLGASLRSGHHHRFEPRLREGAWLAKQPQVRAMMDISDGLAKDLRALTPANTLAALDPKAVPRRPGASLREALCDGEDYELAVVIDRGADRAAFASKWRRAFPRVPLTCIGRFVHPGDLPQNALPLADYTGYEHLKR